MQRNPYEEIISALTYTQGAVDLPALELALQWKAKRRVVRDQQPVRRQPEGPHVTFTDDGACLRVTHTANTELYRYGLVLFCFAKTIDPSCGYLDIGEDGGASTVDLSEEDIPQLDSVYRIFSRAAPDNPTAWGIPASFRDSQDEGNIEYDDEGHSTDMQVAFSQVLMGLYYAVITCLVVLQGVRIELAVLLLAGPSLLLALCMTAPRLRHVPEILYTASDRLFDRLFRRR